MRVILADDHGLLRDSIQAYLQKLDRAALIDTAADLDESLKLASGLQPFDLVLFDLDSGETFLPAVAVGGDPDSDGKAETEQAAADGKLEAFGLSRREAQVLGYLVHGMSNKEIAREIDLQEVTIKLNVRGLLRKVDARNRTQILRRAYELGLVN